MKKIIIIFLFCLSFISFNLYSQAPANDVCASAIDLGTISANTCFTANTTNATQSLGNASYCTSQPTGSVNDNDVWYKFTTPSGSAPACWTFNATRGTATGDMMMRIFKTCASAVGSSGVASAGSSYVCDGGNYLDISSAAFTPADWVAGTTYYIQIDNRGNSSSGGTINACIKPNMVQAANDLCSSPINIGTASLSTDNATSGCEYSAVAAQDANVTAAQLCAGSLENTSWYSFTAQNTGSAITITFANIDCNGGGGGFQVGFFQGTCAAKTYLNCTSGASGTVIFSVAAAGVVAGQKYLVAMDGNAGSNCHFAISGTNIIPLPIELTMFNARLNVNYVDLIWATATETNNDYFTVERSSDGINFEPIANIKGAGNSLQEKKYYAQDKNPLLGTSYYRLKQTDFDKKTSYSVIQSISLDEKDQFDFVLYPNPSNENEDIRLQFHGKENDLIGLKITDIAGKVLSEKEIKLNSNTLELDLKHHFGSGIYFIKVSNKAGKVINRKFIVQ